MCGGREVYKVLFPAPILDLLPDSCSHHHLSQFLYFAGCEEHPARDHLPPPMVDTVRLRRHVGSLPHSATSREIHRQDQLPRTCSSLPLPSWSHAQSFEVREKETLGFLSRTQCAFQPIFGQIGAPFWEIE